MIGEAVEPYSYMKFPYYKRHGYPNGMYRVGPLARLNNCDRCGTPFADVALAEFRTLQEARPRGQQLPLSLRPPGRDHLCPGDDRPAAAGSPDPGNADSRPARSNQDEGIGVAEAPRGLLIHHYRINPQGLMTWMNLIIATGHNNLAMNRGVKQVAERYVHGNQLQEGMLNRVEALIRCYDPCLSCASHAVGQMPLHIQLRDATGRIVDEVKRA